MEQYIINRKQITLEKNKEFSFRIPVAIKPVDCEFQIETSYFDQSETVTIIFNLKGIKGESENKILQIPVEITNTYSKFNLSAFNSDISNDDHLLIGCICNKSISISLSILKNQVRFM
jgi:hypothetical protein